MITILVRLAPTVLKVAKAIVVIAPHVITVYQYQRERKSRPNRRKPK